MDPTAQGTDAAPAGPQQSQDSSTPAAPAQPAQHEGFQARIDQLVAQRESERLEFQAQLQAQQAQMLEMVERMAMQRQAPQEQLPQIDPEQARAVQHMLAQQMGPLQAQLAQMAKQLEQTQFQQQVAQEDPRVVQEANRLMGEWRKRGLNGWTMNDAIVYARGALGVPTKGAARAPNGQFAPVQPMTGQSAPPPAAPPVRTVEVDLSSTDTKYLDRQAAALEQALGDTTF